MVKKIDKEGFFCSVEAFLELDINSERSKIISDHLLNQARIQVKEKVYASSVKEPSIEAIVDILSELKVENHLLKAAWLERCRYESPQNFEEIEDISQNILSRNNLQDGISFDIRSEITGRNWYSAEPHGRWAGPDNESSLMVPALGCGKYEIIFEVTGQIEKDTIDKTSIHLNNNPLNFVKKGMGSAIKLHANCEVSKEHKLPFWIFDFKFTNVKSPFSLGGADKRLLSICLKSISLRKL